MVLPLLARSDRIVQLRFVGVAHGLGRVALACICDVKLLFHHLFCVFLSDLHQDGRPWPICDLAQPVDHWVSLGEHLNFARLRDRLCVLLIERPSVMALSRVECWQDGHAGSICHLLVREGPSEIFLRVDGLLPHFIRFLLLSQ